MVTQKMLISHFEGNHLQEHHHYTIRCRTWLAGREGLTQTGVMTSLSTVKLCCSLCMEERQRNLLLGEKNLKMPEKKQSIICLNLTNVR